MGRAGRARSIARVLAPLVTLAVALAACGGAAPTPSPAPPTAAATAGPTAFNGQTLQMSAKALQFSPKAYEVPAGQDFEIQFVNEDPEFSHAVYVTEGVRPATMQTIDEFKAGPYPFKGDYIKAGGTTTYHVGALTAGTYQFFCPPHPDMVATLVVK